jgi:hypothetical protein
VDDTKRYSLSPLNYASHANVVPFQEIKRRTKTGCLTCRKRRIKVSCPTRSCLLMDCERVGSYSRSKSPHRRMRSRLAETRILSSFCLLQKESSANSLTSATKPTLPAETARSRSVSVWATIPYLSSSPVLRQYSQHLALLHHKHLLWLPRTPTAINPRCFKVTAPKFQTWVMSQLFPLV